MKYFHVDSYEGIWSQINVNDTYCEFPASVILNPKANEARTAMMNYFKEKDLCKDM